MVLRGPQTGRSRCKRGRDGILALARMGTHRYASPRVACPATELSLSPQGICAAGTQAPTDVNSTFPFSFGIGVEDGALADIEHNEIISTLSPFALGIGRAVAFLVSGIHLVGADGDSRVRGNTVSGAYEGIVLGPAVIVVGTVAPTAATAGPEIRNNTVTDSFIGFALAVEGANHVHGNDAHLNFAGILVIDSSANVIHDNDFRGNLEVDCFDETIGTGTAGTDNNWSDNLGNSNSPIGLCTADPV